MLPVEESQLEKVADSSGARSCGFVVSTIKVCFFFCCCLVCLFVFPPKGSHWKCKELLRPTF